MAGPSQSASELLRSGRTVGNRIVLIPASPLVAEVVVVAAVAVAARHLGGEVERRHAEAQVLQDGADVSVALEDLLLVRGEVRVDER